jgi:hypothetical protein
VKFSELPGSCWAQKAWLPGPPIEVTVQPQATPSLPHPVPRLGVPATTTFCLSQWVLRARPRLTPVSDTVPGTKHPGARPLRGLGVRRGPAASYPALRNLQAP